MDELLNKYIESFYGFGSYNAKYWFIGMEPGSTDPLGQLKKRLNAWKKAKCPDLHSDIKQYHEDICEPESFQGDPKNGKPNIQRTWGALIRTVLAIENPNQDLGDKAIIRAYQKDKLARRDGNECLLELFPMPCKGKNDWQYQGWGETRKIKDLLQCKEHYRNMIKGHRIKCLQKMINERKSTAGAVIFYGLGYFNYWCQVMGPTKDKFKLEPYDNNSPHRHSFYAKKNSTVFAVMKHPSRMPNRYFEEVGEKIRKLLNY